jgi:hypothetical protein
MFHCKLVIHTNISLNNAHSLLLSCEHFTMSIWWIFPNARHLNDDSKLNIVSPDKDECDGDKMKNNSSRHVSTDRDLDTV